MRRYKSRIYTPVILATATGFGVLTIVFSIWFSLAIIICMSTFIYMEDRSENIDHYFIGVDLDTNPDGDMIEISIYAFNRSKNCYYPVNTYIKQLRIYVNVIYLDKFYENIGYPIVEDLDFLIRKVVDSRTQDIKIAKQFYKKMIQDFNQNYKYSAGSLKEKNLEQPNFSNTKPGFRSRFWNWWTFKSNN